MTLSLNDYFTIFTLIIALTGGIPGVLSFLNDRVKLVIHCYSLSYGTFEDTTLGIKQTFLAVPLTIYNHGDRPLYAVSILANIKIDNKKSTLTPIKVTETIHINSTAPVQFGIEAITTLEPMNDLQSKRLLVTKESSQAGYLAFLCPEVSLEFFTTKKFWIEFTIVDNTEKKYKFRHVFNIREEINASQYSDNLKARKT